MRTYLKLSEKYENHFIDKAAETGKKDFRRYVNNVLRDIEDKQQINQRVLRKASKKYGIRYKEYENIIDAGLILAPVFNYVSQSPEIRKSKELRPLRNEIRKLFQDSDLRKPRAVIEKAYGIVEDAKSGVKSPATKSFIDYMNQIEPQREAIIQGAVDRLSGYNKSLKRTISKNILNDYLAYIEGGGSKEDAILYTLKSNSVKNDNVIKRYLQTEAHEDFEKAKIENAKIHGFKYKYWRTQSDERVRFSHMIMQGKIVANDEPFKLGKHQAMWPGDTNLPIEERINCRCFTEFQFVPRGTRKGFELPTPKEPEIPKEPKIKINEDEEKKPFGEEYLRNSAGVYDKEGKKKVDRKKMPMNEIYYDATAKIPGWYVDVRDEEKSTRFSIKVDQVPVPEEWIEEEFAIRANENVWKRSYDGNPGLGMEKVLEMQEEFDSLPFEERLMLGNSIREMSGKRFLEFIELQNYDKPPKIISKDDLFNREPEELGMVVVRGYYEPGNVQGFEKNNIRKYREDFENGDFYLENSGGSLFGRGMYTATIYNGIDKKDVYKESTIKHTITIARQYANIRFDTLVPEFGTREESRIIDIEERKRKINQLDEKDFQGRVDIMHLPKDFKYVDYDDIEKEKQEFSKSFYSRTEEGRKKIEIYEAKRKELDEISMELSKERNELDRIERDGNDDLVKAKVERIVELSTLQKEKRQEYSDYFNDELPLSKSFNRVEPSVAATLMGFDGIYVKNRGYMVVLNRSKVEVVEQDKEFELNHLRAGNPLFAQDKFGPSEDNEIFQLGLRLNGIGVDD